ncbi:SAV_915 family protein [Amycolatopsis sp. CA-230715]|uniref:SAV_915 family protein n=1 Tax=Amycolatopsis sp. CA-230715 TaxID=2745196 RepID=UPI001C01B151|nr:SAV_915 family protein [Amycolatopsis sp. CA-230715]
MTNPTLPPVLYVPTSRPGPGGEEAHVELRRTGDGRTVLMAYSALDRLVSCCGEGQAWVLIGTEHLPKIHERLPYDVIFLDTDIPEDLRHPV